MCRRWSPWLMSIGMPPDSAEIHRKTQGSGREPQRRVRHWDGECAPADSGGDKPLLPRQRSHGGDPTHVGTARAREKRLAEQAAPWPSARTVRTAHAAARTWLISLVDRTGLTGIADLELTWAPDTAPTGPFGSIAGAGPPSRPRAPVTLP